MLIAHHITQSWFCKNFSKISVEGWKLCSNWLIWCGMKHTTFLCPFSILTITLFVYYTSVPAGTEARTEINK